MWLYKETEFKDTEGGSHRDGKELFGGAGSCGKMAAILESIGFFFTDD